MVVDLVTVSRAPGVRHPVRREAPLPGGITLPGASVPPEVEVTVDLVVEAAGSTVVVEGVVVVPWTGVCRRCLEEASGVLELDIRELYTTEPVEGETYPLPEERLDLAPMLREVISVELPVAPVCREDCPGPDPDTHPVTVEDPEGREAPRRTDDPWAALDDLRLE
jgi:uncharacterized protein